MKKFGKILSSVLAASMVVSAFAMTAFASKAHTVTVTADKTEGLVAGDTVTVEIAIDNTEALASCDYVLSYDTSAFKANTAKVNRLEACIDKSWLDGIKDTDGDWGYYLGSPTYNVTTAGQFKFAWAGSEGVEADYAMDNRVIGKFFFQVVDGVADGEYSFTLTGNTGDAGDNSKAAMVTVPATVTVGAPAPSFTDATVDFEYKTILGESGVNWTRGILGTVNFKAAENNTFNTIVVTPEKDGVKANKSIEFDVADDVTFENDITVKCALNIKKCADEATANSITATGSVK